MSFAVKFLINKREEYQTLLDLVNRQFKQGNVFRSQMEIDSAKGSKAYYEEVVKDIDDKLNMIISKGKLIKSDRSVKDE